MTTVKPVALDLHVHEDVQASLAKLPPRPWEVGGWLLGYWSVDRSAIVVTHSTPSASRGTPFGVTISGHGHRRLFDEIYDRTGGRATFIGDWHTHPAGPAQPSLRDLRALAQLASDPDYGTPMPLIAITAIGRWRRRSPHTRWWVRTSQTLVIELRPRPYAGPAIRDGP